LVFLFLFLNANASWSFSDEFSLKKDEFVLYKINEKDLLFRWTLFHNDGLVFILKYDHFPYQGILYQNHKLNSFRLKTTSQNVTGKERPFCDIVFLSCEKDKSSCKFQIYCRDKLSLIKKVE